MNPIRPALIIIDMINNFDFTHGPILAKKASHIASSIKNLKDQFNEKKYELLVPKDCIASADDNDNQYALTMMENVLKAKINPSIDEIYKHYIIYPLPPS